MVIIVMINKITITVKEWQQFKENSNSDDRHKGIIFVCNDILLQFKVTVVEEEKKESSQQQILNNFC